MCGFGYGSGVLLFKGEFVGVFMSGVLNVSVCDWKKYFVWFKLFFVDLEIIYVYFFEKLRIKSFGWGCLGWKIGLCVVFVCLVMGYIVGGWRCL